MKAVSNNDPVSEVDLNQLKLIQKPQESKLTLSYSVPTGMLD
jgi:hypothetical protein